MENKSMESITKIQPELQKLFDKAGAFMAEESGSYADRAWYWYHDLKPEFINLIGFDSTISILANTSAYDATYGEFIRILKI